MSETQPEGPTQDPDATEPSDPATEGDQDNGDPNQDQTG